MVALKWIGKAIGVLLIAFFGVVLAFRVTLLGIDLMHEALVDGAVPALACAGGRAASPVKQQPPADVNDLPQVEQPEDVRLRNLGRDREPVTILTTLRLSEPLPADVRRVNVVPGPFERADGHGLEPVHLQAESEISPGGRRDSIRVLLCVDPVVRNVKEPSGPLLAARAGSYTGTVVVDDPRVTSASVTYRVNLQYEKNNLVVLVVVLSGLLGGGVGLLLASGVNLAAFHTRAGLVRALTAVSLGVAAVYTVYSAQYLRDPSWQGDAPLFHALIATCVGAAYAATNVAGTVTVSRTDG